MGVRLTKTGIAAAALGTIAAVGCVTGTDNSSYECEELGSVEQAVTATSRVLVNQLGYVSSLKKVASVTGSGCNGKTFWVKSGSNTVFSDTTAAAVTDAGSGDVVCDADFTTYTGTGTFTLQVDTIATLESLTIASSGANLYPQSLYENSVYYFTYHRAGTQSVNITLPGSAGGNLTRNWTMRSNTSLTAKSGWASGTFPIDKGHADAGDFGLYADNAVQGMWALINLVEFKNPTLTLPKLRDTTKDWLSEIIYGTSFMNGLLPTDTTKLASHKCHDDSWGA